MSVVTLGPSTVSATLGHGVSCNYSFAAFHAHPEEAAEDYVMKRMRPGEVAIFRRHATTCRACAKRVAETRDFIRAIRDASARFPMTNRQK